MEASTQTVASFADLVADLTHGRISPSPMLDRFTLVHPPGLAPPGVAPPGLESLQLVHKHQISVADLWIVYQRYLQERNERLQQEQRSSGFKLDLASALADTAPGKPPGKFDTKATVLLKARGTLERVGSRESLVSTAASATGEDQGDAHKKPSSVVVALAALEPAVDSVESRLSENKQHITSPSFEICPGSSVKLMVKPSALPEAQSAVQPTVVGVEEITTALRVERQCNGHFKASWSVDAKKLSGKNQHIVSPSFEISPGSTFKLMVKPKPLGQRSQSFDKACGWGAVDLKLMDDVVTPTLCFSLAVGGGSDYGPIEHDFGNNTIGGMANDDAFVDLRSALDPNSKTLLITLLVFPGHA